MFRLFFFLLIFVLFYATIWAKIIELKIHRQQLWISQLKYLTFPNNFTTSMLYTCTLHAAKMNCKISKDGAATVRLTVRVLWDWNPRDPAALSWHNTFINLLLNSYYFIEYVFGIFVILVWRMTLIFSCLKSELISVDHSQSRKSLMAQSQNYYITVAQHSSSTEFTKNGVWFPPNLIVSFRSSARCLGVPQRDS